MAKPGATGLRRILNAGYYSFKGFKAGFKHEAAVRQELFLAIPLTLLSFYLADDLAVLLLFYHCWNLRSCSRKATLRWQMLP